MAATTHCRDNPNNKHTRQTITGKAYLAARGNHGRGSRHMGNRYGPPIPNDIYSSNVSKPQKHLFSPLLANCREQNDTNRKYCSASSRVVELNNQTTGAFAFSTEDRVTQAYGDDDNVSSYHIHSLQADLRGTRPWSLVCRIRSVKYENIIPE